MKSQKTRIALKNIVALCNSATKTALFSLLLLIFSIPSTKLNAVPFGTNLGSFNGVTAYSNGSTGYACSGSGCNNYQNGVYMGLKWQCVEYARRYMYSQYGKQLPSLGSNGGAKNFATINLGNGFVRYVANLSFVFPATVNVQVGDAVVTTHGTYGHIGIVREVSDNYIRVAQQNFTNGYDDINYYVSKTNYSNGTFKLQLNSNHKVKAIIRAVNSTFPPAIIQPSSNTASIPVNFDWTTVSGGVYRIQVSKSANGWTAQNGFSTAQSCNSTLVINKNTNYTSQLTWSSISSGICAAPQSNTTYYWTVRAHVNGQSTSAYTPVQSFTVSGGNSEPCNTFSSVSASPSNNSAIISINGTSGATNFAYNYRPVNSSVWSGWQFTSSSSFQLSSLQASTQYIYQIAVSCPTAGWNISSYSYFTTTGSSGGGGNDGGCVSDAYEANNSLNQSYTLGSGSFYNLQDLCLTTNDNDYFRINANGSNYFIRVKGYSSTITGLYRLTYQKSGNTMVIETHSENNSNTDTYLYLYNASGSQIASNDDYSGVFSKITYSIPSEPGTGGGGGNDQSYCSSSGNNSNYEWINRVRVSGTPQLNNTSGNNNGYGNFSSSSWTTLSAGNSYYTRLYPGFSESTYQEYWKVWIDFNQDGDFNDSGENVFSDNGTSSVSGYIYIPNYAANGQTRMRVSMRWNNAPTSCGTFDYGEVEDYTITIVGGQANLVTIGNEGNEPAVTESLKLMSKEPLLDVEEEENYFSFIESTDLLENSSEELELNLFPNPIRQSQELVLNISFPASNEENISVTIVDVEGRTHFNHLMDTAAGDEQINVPMTGFQPGMYFCRIQSKAKVVVERFIVQ